MFVFHRLDTSDEYWPVVCRLLHSSFGAVMETALLTRIPGRGCCTSVLSHVQIVYVCVFPNSDDIECGHLGEEVFAVFSL